MSKRKPKIYISAPITGYDLDERRKQFAKWAQVLIDAGCEPVNPMDKDLPDEAPYREHMKEDISLLLDCDGYVISNRFTQSQGCQVEDAVAFACGIEFVGYMREESGEMEFELKKLRKVKSKIRKE